MILKSKFTLLFFLCFLPLFGQIITDTKEISVCDFDGDGFVQIPFSQLQNYALDILIQFNESPEIFVTKAHRGIEKIINLYDNPQVVQVCGDMDGAGGYYDIAINNQNEIYITRKYGVLQKVNTQNCTLQTIGQIHSNGQSVLALSFDHLNFLYEGGWTSKVYRAHPNNLSQFHLWHDFGLGNPSGDFVQIGNFLYIAWTMPDGKDHLFKVTLGENNAYVSHQDLGKIKTGTFGLAAEYGRLYGNTENELYEINLETMDLTTVKNRPQGSSANAWWGAAGLHEALNIQISYHATQQNAMTGNSPLNDPYTNPIAHQDSFVYIRVHEATQNTTYIIPVHILIDVPPAAQNRILSECKDLTSGLATFNLTEIQPEINPDASLDFSYFETLEDLHNNQNPLSPTLSIPSSQTIYAKVSDGNSICYGIAELKLIISEIDLNFPTEFAFCSGTEIVLNIPDEFNSYEWEGLQGEDQNQDIFSNEVIVSHPGMYWVHVLTTDGCDASIPIEVVIGGEPVITGIQMNSDNSITVNVSPSGIYEYSLDGIFWQSSSTFQNIIPDDYLIHVRDFVGCYGNIHKFTYYHIPNFISPNNDGINDTWQIRGVNQQYEQIYIQIFDRNGKLFVSRKVSSSDILWDGTYMGRAVSSGTYWYILQIDDEKIVGSIHVRNN